jgi:hypothetical protein
MLKACILSVKTTNNFFFHLKGNGWFFRLLCLSPNRWAFTFRRCWSSHNLEWDMMVARLRCPSARHQGIGVTGELLLHSCCTWNSAGCGRKLWHNDKVPIIIKYAASSVK